MVVDCSPQVIKCGIMQRIDAIPVDIDITLGTSSPETTYIGLAGIAQINVSFLVRCADGYYGQDCLTSCPNFESCAGCGLSGFTGEFCQHDIDDCENVNCNDGGCVDEINGFTCQCNPGFFGDACENTDHCFGITCSENGQCVNLRDTFTCTCEIGYTGNQCQVESELHIILLESDSSCFEITIIMYMYDSILIDVLVSYIFLSYPYGQSYAT